MKRTEFLNFGAGTPAPFWTNVDVSPYFRIPRFFYRIAAIFGHKRSKSFINNHYEHFHFKNGKKLPFADNSFSYIYCSHVLEHLLTEDIEFLLQEFRRVLKKGGVLRILFPDMMKSLKEAYTKKEPLIDFCTLFMTLPYYGRKKPFRSAYEALFRFPGVHKTILNFKDFKIQNGKKWKFSTQKKYLQSIIEKKYLEDVESKRHCENAFVFDMTLIK